ncbi:hypothetical protein GCM10023347_27330 [Streptomyces chumphonensis]
MPSSRATPRSESRAAPSAASRRRASSLMAAVTSLRARSLAPLITVMGRSLPGVGAPAKNESIALAGGVPGWDTAL